MTPSLFSVSYAGYWGQHTLSLPDFFAKAAELGYPSVMVAGKRPHLSVVDYPDDDSLAELREAAQTAGVEVSTIAGYTDFTSGRTSAEVPFVEIQVQYVYHLSRMARALGAKIIRVFSGYSGEADDYHADWCKCVKALRESAEVAAGHGVVLGLQNHHDIGVSVDAYEELLDDVNHPSLRAMFDPWSIALQGADLHEAGRRMAPRMVQTTLADYVKIQRFAYQPHLVNYRQLDPPTIRAVALGDGFIDQQAFFAGLQEGGFDGYIAYEMCSPVRGGPSEANLDATAAKSLQVIRRLWSGDGL